MRVVDISGPIYEGMWNYPEPMGTVLKGFTLSCLEFEHGGERYTVDKFDHMKAQTGTYLESPGRYLEGNRYTVSDIPIEKLHKTDAYVLLVPYEKMPEKDDDDLEAIRTAIDFEAKGAAYYAKIRDEVTEPREKEFFDLLSKIEHEHYLSLKDTEEYFTDPTSWYVKSEHHGLDGA